MERKCSPVCLHAVCVCVCVSVSCLAGTHFTKIVTRQDGFEWKNDAKKGTRLQKFGMIATEVRTTPWTERPPIAVHLDCTGWHT